MKLITFLAVVILLNLGVCAEARMIIVLFDGTWNEPDFEVNGTYPQGDSTNVEKLKHLLVTDSEQTVFYVSGIGTDGKQPIRVKDGAFGESAQEKVDDAYKLIIQNYKSGDELAIFGFSRGAATARILARRIRTKGINGAQATIGFMGLWDTVAAFGVPFPDIQNFRKQYDDAEERLRIPSNVKSVVHLVSIDESRALFAPSLLTSDSDQIRVNETWFAGNHGDVGGGWVKATPNEKQLSDITLEYMVRVSQAELSSIRYKSDWQNKLSLPKNAEGIVHDVGRFAATSILGGSYPRKCSSLGSPKARLHLSVKNKLAGDSNYRPAALDGGLTMFEIIE